MKSAKKLNATEETAALQAVVNWNREWIDSAKGHTNRLREGGLMSVFEIIPETKINNSAWRIERKLEAATFDVAALGLACVVILVIVVIFSAITFDMRMSGRHPFIFIMPKETYKRLFQYCILLPAADSITLT